MRVIDKLNMDRDALAKHGPINIVIFGDSVSQASFNGYNDYESVYWNLLKKKLYAIRSYVPVNMICASIGGTRAKESLVRFDSQVLSHRPDLIIICFGLNDVNSELEDYLGALNEMFKKSKDSGCDVIFMTPNMLCTRVADDAPEEYKSYAARMAEHQNGGRMDTYIYSAKKLAEDMGITVCDCYSKWKELSKTEDITLLLSNRINHPTPKMHELFADSLYEIITENKYNVAEADDGMYK